jgi:hypothetical protein
MIDRDITPWITRDGRELPVLAMDNQHLHNAVAVMTGWSRAERDPDKKRELKDWLGQFKLELKRRRKAALNEMKRRQGMTGVMR